MVFKVRLELAHSNNCQASYDLEKFPLLPGSYTNVSVPVFIYEIPCNTRLWLHISNADGNDSELNGGIILTRSNHMCNDVTDPIPMHHKSVILVGLPIIGSWLHYCSVGAYITGKQLKKIQVCLDHVCRHSIQCNSLLSIHICGVINQEEIDETIFVRLSQPLNTPYHSANQYVNPLSPLVTNHGDAAIFQFRGIDEVCLCGFCNNPISSEKFTQRQRFLLKLNVWAYKSRKRKCPSVPAQSVKV